MVGKQIDEPAKPIICRQQLPQLHRSHPATYIEQSEVVTEVAVPAPPAITDPVSEQPVPQDAV